MKEEITKKPHFFREAFFFFFKVHQNCKEKNRRVLDLCTIVIDPSSLCGIWISCDSRFCLGKNNKTQTLIIIHDCLDVVVFIGIFSSIPEYKSHILVWPLTGNWGIWVFRFSWTKTIISSDRKPPKCSRLKIRKKMCNLEMPH